MNWIEIDKFLLGLIAASKSQEQLYADAMKKFSWNQSQADAAIKPLLKRNADLAILSKPAKKASKTSTKHK